MKTTPKKISTAPRALGLCSVVLALFAGSATAAPPGVRYVRAEAPDGGDGQSWATAYNLVRAALAEADASGGAITEIWVKEGSYRPLYLIPEGAGLTFTLVPGVGLYGGFDGTETDRDQRDPAAHVTILNGDLGGFYVNATVTAAGNPATILDGFTVTHNNPPTGSAIIAIGINATGSATIRNCTMTGSCLGMRVTGNPTVTDCVIDNNSPGSLTAAGGGAGAGVTCLTGSSATFINCVITDNRSRGSWSGQTVDHGAGAGLYATNCSVHLVDCLVSNNLSGWGGYGSGCVSGQLEGGADGASGAGFYFKSAAALLEGCTISGNITGSATTPGGCSSGSEVGRRSGDGGGIYALNSALVAVNCVITGNQTGAGGTGGSAFGIAYRGGDSGNGAAVWSSGGAVELVNCTLADNAIGAAGPGGSHAVGFPPADPGNPGTGKGIYGDAVARVDNSILWDGGISEISGSITALYSDIQGGYAGTGNINADPMFVNAAAGDYRLSATSPCIDAANSLVDTDPSAPGTQPLPATDADGLARRVDITTVADTGIGAPVVDMGAYEVQICIADLNGDGLVDFADYLEFLNLYDATDPRADFNGDGLVDFADYLEFLNLYDAGC